MNTSTFTPSTTGADTLTIEQVQQSADGCFGSGNNDAVVVNIAGALFNRNVSNGDLEILTPSSVPAETRFRRLAGAFHLELVS